VPLTNPDTSIVKDLHSAVKTSVVEFDTLPDTAPIETLQFVLVSIPPLVQIEHQTVIVEIPAIFLNLLILTD